METEKAIEEEFPPYLSLVTCVSDKEFSRLAFAAGWTTREVEEGIKSFPRIDEKIALVPGQPEKRWKPHAETIRQLAQSVGL